MRDKKNMDPLVRAVMHGESALQGAIEVLRGDNESRMHMLADLQRASEGLTRICSNLQIYIRDTGALKKEIDPDGTTQRKDRV